MVRREEDRTEPRSGEVLSSRRTSPAGASPVPVGVGAPGSRPQPNGRDPGGRAGRREGPRTEQARGPQHQVKLAASSEKQSGSRAAHFTAKATPAALAPKRAVGPGGVGSAARVQGGMRNSGDPSASPSSGQGGSYKPVAKSSVAQRESEGVEVPTMRAKKNARGGKDPCFGHARQEGKRKGMAAKSGPNDPVAIFRDVHVREPRSELLAGAERGAPRRTRATQRPRGDARGWARAPRRWLAAHAPPRRPSVSRVREIRTHGLKGGPALSLVSFNLNL